MIDTQLVAVLPVVLQQLSPIQLLQHLELIQVALLTILLIARVFFRLSLLLVEYLDLAKFFTQALTRQLDQLVTLLVMFTKFLVSFFFDFKFDRHNIRSRLKRL